MGRKVNKIYPIVFVGVMAAMVFVATYFLRFEIPTPTGPTNIKVANILCLLSGMLFGGLYGGLAAGIGSMFFDLFNPIYAPSAPFTLLFFFAMGGVCGFVSHLFGKKGMSTPLNIFAGTLGALSYMFLYIGKNVLELMLAGSAFMPALIANGTKIFASGLNAVVAVTFATLLAKPLNDALRKAGVLDKMGR